MTHQSSLYSRFALVAVCLAAALTGIIHLFGPSWQNSAMAAISVVLALLLLAIIIAPIQKRALEQRLAKFNIDLKSGRINEANLRRMYHAGGRAQLDALMVYRLIHRCSIAQAHAAFERKPR